MLRVLVHNAACAGAQCFCADAQCCLHSLAGKFQHDSGSCHGLLHLIGETYAMVAFAVACLLA